MEAKSKLLDKVVETSQNSVSLINVMFDATLSKEQVLKHFVLWVLLTKEGDKALHLNHTVHSNWKTELPEHAELLAKIVLLQFARKIGLKKLEEILTDLRLGGINDTEDNIN